MATKYVMEKYNIPGKVVLFGTPAEEGTFGFLNLVRRLEWPGFQSPQSDLHSFWNANGTLWSCLGARGREALSKSRWRHSSDLPTNFNLRSA